MYAITLPTPLTLLDELSSVEDENENKNENKNENENENQNENENDLKDDLNKRTDVEMVPAAGEEANPCLVCLGTLHHLDHSKEDESDGQVQGSGESSETSENDAVARVLQAVRQGGHMFDSFCLEISLPAVTLVRERALWYIHSQQFLHFSGQ